MIESMNWLFMLDEAKRLNPRFWFEISAWDGSDPALTPDRRKLYAKVGQPYSPTRWSG